MIGQNRASATGRFLLAAQFVLLAIVPFNYLQFAKIPIGHFKVPFYYPLLTGLGVATLISALCVPNRLPKDLLVMPWLLAVGPLVSTAAGWRQFGPRHSLATFLLMGPVTLYAVLQCFNDEDEILSGVNVALITGVIVAALGILEAFFQKNVLYHSLYTAQNPYYTQVLPWRGGVSSTIGHALPLGAYLAGILPLSLAVHRVESSVLFVLILLLGILVTVTRSSWIAATIAITGILWFRKKRFVSILLPTTCCIALFYVASLSHVRTLTSEYPTTPIDEVLKNRLDPRTIWSEIFHSHRTASYRMVKHIMKTNALFGIGFGNYPKAYDEFRVEGVQANISSPDNEYLRWLAENGLIGSLGLVAFWALFAKALLKNLKTPSSLARRSLLTALCLSIGSSLINFMALDGFFWLATNFSFWFMVGLAMRLIQITSLENAPGAFEVPER